MNFTKVKHAIWLGFWFVAFFVGWKQRAGEKVDPKIVLIIWLRNRLTQPGKVVHGAFLYNLFILFAAIRKAIYLKAIGKRATPKILFAHIIRTNILTSSCISRIILFPFQFPRITVNLVYDIAACISLANSHLVEPRPLCQLQNPTEREIMSNYKVKIGGNWGKWFVRNSGRNKRRRKAEKSSCLTQESCV